MMHRKVVGLLTVVVAFAAAVPAVAAADAGSITGVSPAGDGQLRATFITTSTRCTTAGFCGWFPQASQVPAGQPCNGSSLVYVGDLQEKSGSQTGTETFFLDVPAIRLCLYVSGPDNVDRLVAQYDYAPPVLTVREAKEALPDVLRSKYHSRFKKRRHFKRSCHRISKDKVRCSVRWDNAGKWRYRGTVTLRNDPDDPTSIVFSTKIKRKRLT
jgi:hypothetical protein